MSKGILPTKGDVVRDARLRMNLSQEGLANLAGVSTTKISHMETGKGARPDVINLVAKPLGLEFNDLLANPLPKVHYGDQRPENPAAAILPLAGHAQFDPDYEHLDLAKQLVIHVERLLALHKGILSYRYERPTHSVWIGMNASTTLFRPLIKMFSDGVFYKMTLDSGIVATIDRFYFPSVTLDWSHEPEWSMHVDSETNRTFFAFERNRRPEYASLRGALSYFASRNIFKIKATRSGGMLVTLPGITRTSSSEVNI